jgi:hypothetical protein
LQTKTLDRRTEIGVRGTSPRELLNDYFYGTGLVVRSPAGRTDIGDGPSGCGRGKARRNRAVEEAWACHAFRQRPPLALLYRPFAVNNCFRKSSSVFSGL